ncbi:nitrilase-related carbon-nitrogen hydrolase [Hirschia litorea]|uniref:Nitrilase-related carbon-nitrogen hydrolase n=1 Tax=Hirschia litorea TaxID=1199156 RepID=A0ABW2IMD3_9PROT
MKPLYVVMALALAGGTFWLGQSTSTKTTQTQEIAHTDAQIPPPVKAPLLVQSNGSYPVKPLEKDNVVVKVIQTKVNSLSDFPSVQEGLDHNLAHMEKMADQACTTGKKPDFLLYHEFPLTGYSSGGRDEKLKYTVQFPGPETDRLGQIAKACDTYLIFGSYATDKDWPNHILSLNVVIDRQGEIAKIFWKSRNIKRIYPDREITTTTIESVRDKYRAMYGIEEEFPVLQTEYGNIAVSTVQMDPFIFAAFAMRGTEIMMRTATLFAEDDVLAMARINDFYSAMSNIAFPADPNNPKYDAGESIIVDPHGNILAKEPTKDQDGIIEAVIPIAEFRKNRKIPNYALEMVQPVFNQYQQEFPLNHMDMPAEELPQTGQAMKAMMESVSRFNIPVENTTEE